MSIGEEELKEFIKNNLLIEVVLDDNYGQGNSVSISLRISDDTDAFCSESIYIPDEI